MYCYTCGAKCEVEKYTYRYNCATGKPVTLDIPRCPNRKWYAGLIFWPSHPVTESDSYVYEG